MIPKIDKPDEARFLHNLVARNDNTYDDSPNISDQSNIVNAVANAKCGSKIDLSDGYHNLRIIPEHKCKESVFSPVSYHVISAYLLTFTPFLQHYNCVMT